MRISTILIYATLLLSVNLSFAHDRKDLEILQEHLTGSLTNLVIYENAKKVPALNLITIDKIAKTINFSENKVTLINFWATWCVPCREEMPSLNNLVKSVNTERFKVIAIAAGRNSDDAIRDFFSKHELLNLGNFKDPKGKVSSSMNILGLPTTIIVDQNSNELARLFGSTDWNSPEVINFIEKVLRHEHK